MQSQSQSQSQDRNRRGALRRDERDSDAIRRAGDALGGGSVPRRGRRDRHTGRVGHRRAPLRARPPRIERAMVLQVWTRVRGRPRGGRREPRFAGDAVRVRIQVEARRVVGRVWIVSRPSPTVRVRYLPLGREGPDAKVRGDVQQSRSAQGGRIVAAVDDVDDGEKRSRGGRVSRFGRRSIVGQTSASGSFRVGAWRVSI
mmetsp:Transcript_2915/g.10868  ORF Transcript_2915/g.10868 Transcript_2915/m.10868 type:complete len:200 (+) Transcript_2915:923-1522(+)